MPARWRVRTNPLIDAAAFPDTRTDVYYVSDSWIPNSMADYVWFADGIVHHVSVGTRGALLCVRP